MNAIVTAGGIPQPGDKLYAYSNGDSKALIDLAGKPMVQWVLDALGELTPARPDDVLRVGQPERYEQEPRLVHVAIVLIDHGDVNPVSHRSAKAVGGQRAARAPAQDHDLLGHDHIQLRGRAVRQGRRSRPPAHVSSRRARA